MRQLWSAASVIAVAATIAPASAQHHGMPGGAGTTISRGTSFSNGVSRSTSMARSNSSSFSTARSTSTSIAAPTIVRQQTAPTITQVRNGPVRPWNGGTRTWNGGNRGWTGSGTWNGGQSRWGGRIDGRWHGGVQAPGGWAAYRRPYRGWALPSYWFAPTFFISDYSAYGLGAPPVGYNWSRYYDDAVLIDGRGRVYDSVGGLNWDRYDGGYAYDDSYDDGDRYYADGADEDYGPRGRDGRRRDDGVGGAVIGGVVGGIAGNAIAGRGDKLAGTLLGAGAGAIAGAAIDRAEDRGRDRRGPPPPRYDERGAPYGYPDRGPPPPHGMMPPPPPPPIVHHGGGYETRVYRSGGGYGGWGYGYYGGTTTTVTVMPTTTTTTETITVYDDVRTAKRVWHAPAKPKTKILHRTPSKTLYRAPSKTLQR